MNVKVEGKTMNYWKQFAEMLGLELGQEFELTYDDGKRKDEYTYKIIEDGLYRKEANSIALYAEPSVTLDCILNGDYKVVSKPWKPKKGEKYWYYSDTCKLAICVYWEDTSRDLSFWKLGNCFKTREEADAKGKEIIEQIRKEYDEA